MDKKFVVFSFILWMFQISLSAQTIVYVDSAATGSNNGTSWLNAYPHIDSALKYSHLNNVDLEIRIAKGTYIPTKKAYVGTTPMTTTDNKDKTFHITNGTSIYGGYPHGGGTRNPLLYPVILSGQLNSNEQAYHVLYQAGGSGTSHIEGITLMNGNCPSGSFTSVAYGGGYYNEDAVDVIFNQVKFIQNNAWIGGAAFFSSGDARFIQCQFEGNSALQSIGGVFSDMGSMYFRGCVFYNNANGCFRSDLNGYVEASSTLFVGNTNGYGGVMFVTLSDEVAFKSCTFYGNQAAFSGGALYTPEPGMLNIYNCIFYNNLANGVSSDVWWGSQTSINARNSSFQNPFSSYATGTFMASGVTSLFFNQNPLFNDTLNLKGADNLFGTSDDGLKLSNTSICINTGSNSYADPNYNFDLVGDNRLQGTIDRGAYERDCGVLSYSTLAATNCGSYFWAISGQTYNASGTYTAQQACTVYTLNLTVNPLPVITVSGAITLCTGTSTQLTLPSAYSYNWMPGNLNSSVVTLAPTLTTNYTITATSTNGCTSSSLLTLVVNQLPSVQTSASATSVCPGSAVTITGTPATNTYVWQPGNFSGNPFTAYPNVATTYTVTGTSTTTGCSKTATRTISMKSVPTITTTASPTSVCSGGTSVLTASGGAPYSWQPGGQTTASITVNPLVTTTYTVTGTSATTGCTKSATRTITVNCGNTLVVTCFIEGFYTGNNTMQPVLSNQGLTNPLNQTDSLILELHQSIFPFDTFFTSKAVLMTNGIVSTYVPATAVGNSYYVVLKHRNALETWSANPVLFSNGTAYNFSDDPTKAFGNNEKQVGAGVYALYSGDVNMDGAIDVFDYLMMDPDITNGAGGYLPTDLNGDGSTDVFDYLLLNISVFDGIGIAKP